MVALTQCHASLLLTIGTAHSITWYISLYIRLYSYAVILCSVDCRQNGYGCFFQSSSLNVCCIMLILAERNDKDELARLIQLILGCAVNCEDKERKFFFFRLL